MRLKLPGAHKQGRVVLHRCLAFVCCSVSLRRRALLPQLKRDPLGSSPPLGVALY